MLEAVITVPADSLARPAEKSRLLLLVHGSRAQTGVAFIAPDTNGRSGEKPYDADAILLALQAFREEAAHPALRVLPPSVIASHEYQFAVADHAAPVTGMAS